jgi:hypothetical protein
MFPDKSLVRVLVYLTTPFQLRKLCSNELKDDYE